MSKSIDAGRQPSDDRDDPRDFVDPEKELERLTKEADEAQSELDKTQRVLENADSAIKKIEEALNFFQWGSRAKVMKPLLRLRADFNTLLAAIKDGQDKSTRKER